jgi:hypothetical protein
MYSLYDATSLLVAEEQNPDLTCPVMNETGNRKIVRKSDSQVKKRTPGNLTGALHLDVGSNTETKQLLPTGGYSDVGFGYVRESLPLSR